MKKEHEEVLLENERFYNKRIQELQKDSTLDRDNIRNEALNEIDKL
jgi:hypothetical protein